VDITRLPNEGQQTMANSISVVIASDQSTVTVDGNVTVTAVDLDIRDLTHASDSVKIGDGANTATVRDLAANDALNVAIVDGSGGHITSFGGGVEYADGDARGSATGKLMMGDDGTLIQSVHVDAAGDLQVDVLTLPSVTIGTFPDNEPFNVAQINGVTPLMGAGATGTGSLRVTAASDSPEVTSLGTMDDWDNAARDGASVSGDTAHDSPDAGEPIKIGGKASSTEPAFVGNGDRVNAYFDLFGYQQVKARITDGTDTAAIEPATSRTVPDLDGLNGLVTHALLSARQDDDTTKGITMEEDQDNDEGTTTDSAVHNSHIPKVYTENLTTLEQEYTSGDSYPVSSASVNCRRFTRGLLTFTLDSTGTPTDIQIQLMFSPDGGSNWFPKADTFWANLYFDDTICATAINRGYSFDCDGDDLIKFDITAAGTGAAGATSFTMSHVFVTLKCR
jgi:hypothetical protein